MLKACLSLRLVLPMTCLLLPGSFASADDLRLIDVHMHYWQPSWRDHPPASIIEKMDANGVDAATVSSIPDEGTRKLSAAAPDRFVMFLNPERQRGDSGWFNRIDLLRYLKERLGVGGYAGIGEFHLFDPRLVKQSRIQRILDAAIERNLILHAHSGSRVIEAMYASEPGLTILWAHAGIHDNPDVIIRMFETYPTLYADLSLRTKDIVPSREVGGRIDPDWMKLFLKFPDRLMVGSDTYIQSRWRDYGKIIGRQRRWLEQLPPDVAEAIANGNARRLFRFD